MDHDQAILHVTRLYGEARVLAARKLGIVLGTQEEGYARRTPGGGTVTFIVEQPGGTPMVLAIIEALKEAELPEGLRIDPDQEDGPKPAVVVRFEND